MNLRIVEKWCPTAGPQLSKIRKQVSNYRAKARTVYLYMDDLTMLFDSLHWMAIAGGVTSAILLSYPNQRRYSRIFTAFKTMLLLTAACFSIILPAISLYSGAFFEPQRSDGIVTGIPCVIWIPINVDASKMVQARLVIMMIEGYIAGTVFMLLIGQQSTAISIGHKLLFEFKVLALAMKTFEKRANWMYRKERGRDAPLKPDGQRTRKYLEMSLKEAVIHHKILIDVAEDFNGIFYVQELVILLASSLLICLSALSILSDVPVEAKAAMLVITGTELGYVFVMCYYGQVLLDGHDVVRNGLYSSNWTNYSTVIGKHVLNIQSRLQRPLSLNAGGFVEVNLDTYAQVVKTSFSYFSLLRAFQE